MPVAKEVQLTMVVVVGGVEAPKVEVVDGKSCPRVVVAGGKSYPKVVVVAEVDHNLEVAEVVVVLLEVPGPKELSAGAVYLLLACLLQVRRVLLTVPSVWISLHDPLLEPMQRAKSDWVPAGAGVDLLCHYSVAVAAVPAESTSNK